MTHAAPDLAEQEAAKAYEKARACYNNLMLNESKQKIRANWETCIGQFAAIARDYAETEKGPDALYTEAKLYRLLAGVSHNKEDATEAYNLYNSFTKHYRKSRYNDDALYQMATIKLYTFGDERKAKRLLIQIIRWDPDGDRVRDAKNLLADIRAGKVKAPPQESLKPQGAILQKTPKPINEIATVTPPVSAATPSPEKKTPKF